MTVAAHDLFVKSTDDVGRMLAAYHLAMVKTVALMATPEKRSAGLVENLSHGELGKAWNENVAPGLAGARRQPHRPGRSPAHQEPLPNQQPAGERRIQPPHGVTGVHEIPPCVAHPWTPGFGLLPPLPPGERFLLVRTGFPPQGPGTLWWPTPMRFSNPFTPVG
jgi:hypothetical protein